MIRIEPRHRIRKCYLSRNKEPKDGVLYFRMDGDGSYVFAGVSRIDDPIGQYNTVLDVHGSDEKAVLEVLKRVEVYLGVKTREASNPLKHYDSLMESDAKAITKSRLN